MLPAIAATTAVLAIAPAALALIKDPSDTIGPALPYDHFLLSFSGGLSGADTGPGEVDLSSRGITWNYRMEGAAPVWGSSVVAGLALDYRQLRPGGLRYAMFSLLFGVRW